MPVTHVNPKALAGQLTIDSRLFRITPLTVKIIVRFHDIHTEHSGSVDKIIIQADIEIPFDIRFGSEIIAILDDLERLQIIDNPTIRRKDIHINGF